MTDHPGPVPHLLPVVAFVSLFALLPVAVLLASGVAASGGWSGAAAVWNDPLNRAALLNSLEQGGLSAAAAFTVGYPAGIFLGRFEWRGRTVSRSLLLVPFLLPTLVIVLAVQGVFGPGGYLAGPLPALRWFGSGIPGIVAVNSLFNAPIVILLTAVGIESSRSDLEDAALTLGASPARVYREVWGPPSLVGGLAGALLTFLFSALAFAAPILMCGARCYTLEARVWSLDTVLLQPVPASLLAGLMVGFLALPTVVYLSLVLRLRRRSGLVRRRPFSWSRPVPALLGVWTVAVIGALLIVLGSVLLRSVSPPAGQGLGFSGWSSLFSAHVNAELGVSAAAAIGNTLALAAAGALIALLLGAVSGFVIVTRPRWAELLRFVLFLPLLISPIVLSFSLAEFWRPLLGGESAAWLLILLSQATLALPFSLQSLYVALADLPASGRESARLLGASPWRAYLDVDLSGVGGAVVAAALFAFALCLGEFTATYFLATPAFTTLPVLLYDLESIRLTAAADAAAALLLLVSLAALMLVALGGRRVEF
ncbi:MAG: ABC transporter permease subunit [Thermoplasmata archaeon]|nr:ABC transporter permease subunit [Thermoplasmata archaeon]